MSDAERAGDQHVRPAEPAALLGVVLAGGKSTRMGVDKATLPHIDGAGGATRSYLEHAVARLIPVVRRVAVSGRPWTGSADVVGLPDEQADLGPAMGVATALRYAAGQRLAGVLVTPVDMPDITSEHLRRLVQAWSQTGNVVCASFDRQRAEPLLAVYPQAALADLEQVLASPGRSLSRWIDSVQAIRVDLPADVGRNVNRPSDRWETK